MIELTVKTLDSQNHAFSVPDDTTVKQLKEKIAESISFPVESQRLIYCGRVLQDDKNLSEYDVNGKVIHLVQRPPPQASRPNGSQSTGRSSSTQQQRRVSHHFRQPRLDGNAMYLGAMAFPADLMDAQGIQAPPSSQSLSQSRIVLALRMLRRAAAVLNRLENPTTTQETQESTDPETPPEEAENGSSSNGESGANASGRTLGPVFTGSIAQAAHAATAAAIAAAVSAAHASGMPITIIREGQQQQGIPEALDLRIEGGTGPETGTDASANSSEAPMPEASAPPEVATDSPASPPTQDAAQVDEPHVNEADTTPSLSSQNEERTQRPEFPRPIIMAGLLDELNRVNQRLQPFLQQYHQLMRDDPAYEANSPTIQESQRIFSSVSEVMHYLSHGYHALSDIMCDFSQTPPRTLRCRPVLIQHSAVLQAGIPIQAQINVMTNRAGSNNGSPSGQDAATRPNAPAANSTPPPDTPSEVPPASTANENNQTQPPGRQGVGQEATFNITPGNVEFFMEVGPGSITIDSLEATVVTNGNVNGVGTGSIEANGGSFPWGAPPPPEFIQNLMQAVAGHMIGRAGNAPSNGTANQAGAGAAGGGAGTGTGGQNSQARGNTATHPTTSTQTRSTSRPHVHLAPATMQGFSSGNFDPFLPCNSHHIRPRRRQNMQQFQHQVVVGGSSEPQAQSQTVEQQEQAPPSAEPQARQEDPPPETQPQAQTQTQPPSQSQPQATSGAQGQQDQDFPELQRATRSLIDIVSNMLGNITPAVLTSLNLAPSPPRAAPRVPPRMNPPTSGTAQAGPPPGMAFFMNMMGGQGPSAAGESQPFNVPLFSQIFEGISGALGGALTGQGPGVTLADFLNSLPDHHSYTEGNSIFIDFLMTLARNLTFQDVIALTFGSGEPLNRNHSQLREFVAQRVLQGEPTTEENIARGVDRLLRELRPYFDIMLEARLREDVDLITTTNRYNQIRLPEIISLIMAEGNQNTFGRDMVRWCSTYTREMSAIILHCCLDGMAGLETIMTNYVQQLTRGIHPAIQDWTIGSSIAHMRNYVLHQNIPLEDIQQFLVYRIPNSVPAPEEQHPPAPTPQTEPAGQENVPEPMETDTIPAESPSVPVVENHVHSTPIREVEQPPPPPPTLTMDADTLPDVVLGSEAWHNVLPSEWVPIIARDSQRQRRQNPQTPFSDAYLSGMPSKRRKVVSSTKPQGSLSHVITESVRHAVDDAGVRVVAGVETAGDDLELQAAYREQVRSAVHDNLDSNPDFTPDRFPNAAKYFTK